MCEKETVRIKLLPFYERSQASGNRAAISDSKGHEWEEADVCLDSCN